MEIEQRYEKLINYLTDYIYTVTIQNGVVVDTIHGPGCVSVTGYTSEDYKKNPIFGTAWCIIKIAQKY